MSAQHTPESEGATQDELLICAKCEGEGEIDDPNPCLRCGYVGCHLIECPACKGTGRIAKATGSAS